MIGIPVSNEVLRKAIELKCSAFYTAMSVANALGGSKSNDWIIARSNSLVDLIEEANRRNLDMSEWKTAVDSINLCDSEPFITATKKIQKVVV